MASSEFRALVVEDDRSWQAILSEILGDAGLAVDVVDNLESAAASIHEKPHRIAVVDLSLGGSDHHNRDGLQVLQAIRRQDPGCASILLSGFATVELAVSVLTEYGAVTCLRKEVFRRAQFRELVNHVLASAPPNAAASYPVPFSPASGSAAPGNAPQSAPDETRQGSEPEKLTGLALVVEDDAGWRSIFNEILADAGLQVHLCSSFGEALGRLRREKYDLSIIDLSLANSLPIRSSWNDPPGSQNLDGYRLLASTRAGGIPTIVVSGVATPVDIERAYNEYGIFTSLQKQVFSRPAFLQVVREALKGPLPNAELETLTEREREVLELLARGLTNKEIAEALVISTNTVKRHLKAIFDKLETRTRSGAAAKAISIGVISERAESE